MDKLNKFFDKKKLNVFLKYKMKKLTTDWFK